MFARLVVKLEIPKARSAIIAVINADRMTSTRRHVCLLVKTYRGTCQIPHEPLRFIVCHDEWC